MLVNRLYVNPTDDTLSYLSSLFSGSPIDLNLETIKVEIMTTQDGLEIDPSRVYVAQAVNVNLFYDSYLQQSNLMCALKSTDLQQRAFELNQEGVVRSFYDWYIPYFCIRRAFPPLSRANRSWRVSIANALCSNERPMTFTGEHVVQEELLSLPDFDFIETMKAELLVRHNG